MTSLAQELESIDRQLADAMACSTARGGIRLTDDAGLLDILQPSAAFSAGWTVRSSRRPTGSSSGISASVLLG